MFSYPVRHVSFYYYSEVAVKLRALFFFSLVCSFPLSILSRRTKGKWENLSAIHPLTSNTVQNVLDKKGPKHTRLEKFENGSFTLKTHQMFSVHTAPETFKDATITGHLDLCLRKLRRGNHVIIVTSPFSKSFVSKCFPSTLKCKASVLKFLRFEEHFRI